MDQIRLDPGHAGMVMLIQHWQAHGILGGPGYRRPPEIHQLKRPAAPVSCIGHGGANIAFVAHLAQGSGIIVDYPAYAIYNGKKRIRALQNLHTFNIP